MTRTICDFPEHKSETDRNMVDEFNPSEDSPWSDEYRNLTVRQCGRTVYMTVTDTDSSGERVTVVSFLSASEARRLATALMVGAQRTEEV